MHKNLPITTALPGLILTQLAASAVYAHFMKLSSDGERALWEQMLGDELEHVDYLGKVLKSETRENDFLWPVNDRQLDLLARRIIDMGSKSFLLRLEGALRLECAELDFGLEALAAEALVSRHMAIGYPGDIADHLEDLLLQAARYEAAPNIRAQVSRLNDIYQTCVSEKRGSGSTRLLADLS